MELNNFNLDSGRFCRKIITSRSQYSALAERKCHRLEGHDGSCVEFPFLSHLRANFKRVADKIVRDSIMTTGAAWKSKEAGPNRILRWVMLLSDSDLLKYGIDMSKLKPQVVSKLREKAADYDSCVKVAMALTFAVYQMPDAPSAPEQINFWLQIICRVYLEALE